MNKEKYIVPKFEYFDSVELDNIEAKMLSGGGGYWRPVEDHSYTILNVSNNIEKLRNLAIEYMIAHNTIPYSVNELILQFIRRNKYVGHKWDGVAGALDRGYINYVISKSTYLKDYFKKDITVFDPKTKQEVDFVHWAATLNAMLYNTEWEDMGIYALMPEEHINNLAGWAGDLQTLALDVLKETDYTNDYHILREKTLDFMGKEDYTFSFDDLLADIDAVNMNELLKNEPLLHKLYKKYYTIGTATRFSDFVGNVLNDKRSEERFLKLVNFYTSYKVCKLKIWPIYKKSKHVISSNQSKAIARGFVDYIWSKLEKN